MATVATVATESESVATVATVATVAELPGAPHDLASPDEREAIALEDGRIPKPYAAAFAALQQRIPAGVDRARWELFLDDSGRFLDAWGAEAHAFGWDAASLFGLHPSAPLARRDCMGLLWLLEGRHVEALTSPWARLSDGLKYYRKVTP